jgi:hypothetical protein
VAPDVDEVWEALVGVETGVIVVPGMNVVPGAIVVPVPVAVLPGVRDIASVV